MWILDTPAVCAILEVFEISDVATVKHVGIGIIGTKCTNLLQPPGVGMDGNFNNFISV